VLRRETWDLLPATTDVRVDVAYAPEFDPTCKMDVYSPQGGNGAAVLFINSGGFRSGIFSQCAVAEGSRPRFLLPHEISVQGVAAPVPILEQFSFAPLLASGVSVFDVRHPSESAASLEKMIRSVHLADSFIREHAEEFGIDPNRVGLWGCSSGGYLALLEALTDRDTSDPRTVVAYYPGGYDFAAEAAQFPEVAEGLPLENGERTLTEMSLRNHIEGSHVSALVIYGEDDHPTITTTCESLAREARAGRFSGKIKALPAVSHQFMTPEGYSEESGRYALSELIAWFEEHLAVSRE